MKVESSLITKLRGADLQGDYRLDPVEVYLEDFGSGRGKVMISCYDTTLSCYWGAMGCPLIEFFLSCDKWYLANKMSRTPSSLPDYSGLVKAARASILRQRRDHELSAEEAKELWEECFAMDDLCKDDLIFHESRLSTILGPEWFMDIPTSPNPDYEYELRIINCAKDIIKMNLAQQAQQNASPAS